MLLSRNAHRMTSQRMNQWDTNYLHEKRILRLKCLFRSLENSSLRINRPRFGSVRVSLFFSESFRCEGKCLLSCCEFYGKYGTKVLFNNFFVSVARFTAQLWFEMEVLHFSSTFLASVGNHKENNVRFYLQPHKNSER